MESTGPVSDLVDNKGKIALSFEFAKGEDHPYLLRSRVDREALLVIDPREGLKVDIQASPSLIAG